MISYYHYINDRLKLKNASLFDNRLSNIKEYFNINRELLADIDFSIILLDSPIDQALVQKLLIRSTKHQYYEKPTPRQNKEKRYPIVFLGKEDLNNKGFDQSSGAIPTSTEWVKMFRISEEDRKKIPLYNKWFDSSIWNFYISIGDDQILTTLEKVLLKIKHNFKKELYGLKVAKEFIELSTRLCRNSVVVDEHEHSKYVVPFLFHSESAAETRGKYDLNEVCGVLENSHNVEWRVLLVDDYSSNRLPTGIEQLEEGEPNKYSIIKSVLGRYASHICVSEIGQEGIPRGKLNFVFDFASSISETIEKLSQTAYDLILLDYLLGDSPYNGRENLSREYSHELLHIMQLSFAHPEKREELQILFKEKYDWNLGDIEGIRRNRCPLDKFWILNISAFQFAFIDRLREQGQEYSESIWSISRGADPINTPELFTYSFIKFVKQQIDEVDFSHKSLVINFIDNATFESHSEVRNWAKSYYQVFISEFGKLHALRQKSQISLFCASMYDFLVNNRRDVLLSLERMRNCLFLLANGTVSDVGQLHRSFEELHKDMHQWRIYITDRSFFALRAKLKIISEYINNI